MNDLTGLDELQPFELKDVPSELEWCVYPEEQLLDKVSLPETAYLTVLALRWILSDTQYDGLGHFETWKVYWKNDGSKIRLYLFKDQVEYRLFEDIDDDKGELEVVQEQMFWELASLAYCEGVIAEVILSGEHPYGDLEFYGIEGVRRLLEDAAKASEAAYGGPGGFKRGRRGSWSGQAEDCVLTYKLQPRTQYTYDVARVVLEVNEDWR